jgi:inositol-1,3,4-trisphosphate 5/6-kinase/inositol-tetrakisphosphate 1-kinase
MFQSSLLYIQAGVLYQTLLISNLLQGLRLFNLDIIREHGTRDRFYVIDINYFPGYGKMPEYEHVFTDFLLSVVQSQCKKRALADQY